MKFKPKYYPCSACGAVLLYSPVKESLFCSYCSNEEKIPTKRDIHTYSVAEFDRVSAPNNREKRELNCPKCGAGYEMEPPQVSTICPYCSTPAIGEFLNPIKPEAIVPFKIEQKKAHDIFAKWIGSLWFAPNELKKLVDTRKKLTGFYLPYWLFDADTRSYYSGERGDAYYVTVERRRIIDGREVIVQEQERRIRWTPVNGRVSRDFVDISVTASETIPISLLSTFKARDSRLLLSFDDRFISGFDTREYTINPKISYQEAIEVMKREIRRDVIYDIGGDEQRVYSIDTEYSNEGYRHALFPIWSAHFKYKGKTYYYAVDGLSGEIAGERPYSFWKIFLLIVAIGLIIALIVGLNWDEIQRALNGY
jgi:DNA-directed RNA polymerase subunit M/transcription elongation factor TFIIS